jgi:hypothetical protein
MCEGPDFCGLLDDETILAAFIACTAIGMSPWLRMRIIPKGAGSNLAPVTMNDEGLATQHPLTPFVYQDFTQESVCRPGSLALRQPSLTCSLDNPLEFLAEGWIVGNS